MTEPRVLLIDIETSPNLAWVWSTWKADAVGVQADWYILTAAWKWLGERTVSSVKLPDYLLYAEDPTNDKSLVGELAHLFDEADLVVGHNSVAFDTPKVQTRMLIHDINPPAPFREVDTCKLARKHFAFASNRLNDLCRQLGIGGKMPHAGFDTWLGCMNGDPKMWALMERYNRQDVVLLEQLYLKLRAWDQKAPNLAAISGKKDACPKCGAQVKMLIRGYRTFSATRRVQVQCPNCRGYSTQRTSEKTPNDFV